jgi:hypothetical protein
MMVLVAFLSLLTGYFIGKWKVSRAVEVNIVREADQMFRDGLSMEEVTAEVKKRGDRIARAKLHDQRTGGRCLI